MSDSTRVQSQQETDGDSSSDNHPENTSRPSHHQQAPAEADRIRTGERSPPQQAAAQPSETATDQPDGVITDEPSADTTTECPECGGHLQRNEQRAEVTCSGCGLVADADRIDHGPEWRAYNSTQREERSRVGSPTTQTLHDKGLSTDISAQDRDAHGNHISERKRRQMNRLRKWNRRFKTTDSTDRNLRHALGEIQRMTSALGLPTQVTETASVIYRRALEEELIPGRSIEAMATAAVYAAARRCDVPRSFEEFYPVTRVEAADDNSETTEVERAYRYLYRELNLKITPADPRNYLDRYITQLDFHDETRIRHVATEFLTAHESANLHSGKSPVSLAAAALYAAGMETGDRQTQKKIARITDTTEVTIRTRYQEMVEAVESQR